MEFTDKVNIMAIGDIAAKIRTIVVGLADLAHVVLHQIQERVALQDIRAARMERDQRAHVVPNPMIAFHRVVMVLVLSHLP